MISFCNQLIIYSLLDSTIHLNNKNHQFQQEYKTIQKLAGPSTWFAVCTRTTPGAQNATRCEMSHVCMLQSLTSVDMWARLLIPTYASTLEQHMSAHLADERRIGK